MKTLCILLSILVVTLSMMPCCSEDDREESLLITEQSSHNEDSCTNCPPLLACGTCAGFVFQTTSFSFQPIALENKINLTLWKDDVLLDWPIKIWQPPKLA